MRWLLIALSLAIASPAFGVQPDEILDDPELEARARDISKDLRCLVCRNENIDDSHASLARDLRLLVRERLVAGDTNDEVYDYVVDRYGEFVLLNPRISGSNLIIWLSGPALLIIGGGLAWGFMRRRPNAAVAAGPSALSEDEAKRLAELTKD